MFLMFMGPCIVLIFWHIIPTRYTSHRVYFYLTLLYMFRALLSPIVCCAWRTPPTTLSNQFQLFHDSSRQQYGVTVTKCCSYSCFVLLTMGDSNARNMYSSCQIEINSVTCVSCWDYMPEYYVDMFAYMIYDIYI
jgi:hypothetical protein